MNTAVPALSIFFMILSMLLVLAIPAALFILLRKKRGAEGVSFFVGAAVMLVFAFILESIVNRAILSLPIGNRIIASVPLTALFGGLMAGIFEETGRLTAFKTVLKNKRGNDYNALMYGAGHGGFEAVVLLLPAMINNLVYSAMINSGTTSVLLSQLSGDTLKTMEQVLEQLVSLPPWYFILGIAERIAAMALHIALSVLVWFAAKRGGRKAWLYALAIFIHAAVDFAAGYMGLRGADALATEAAVYVLTALAAVIAYLVWRKNKNADAAPGEESAEA